MKRIKAGYVTVPNPYYPQKISWIDLRPDAVTAIVFWSRYPGPLVPYIMQLKDMGYRFYFLVTITNYPALFEPNHPDLQQVVQSCQELSQEIGAECLRWRYDPIFFTDKMDEVFHLQNFASICRQLSGFSTLVIISLMDEYRKTLRHLAQAQANYTGDAGQRPGIEDFLANLAAIARQYGFSMESCAEKYDFSHIGILPSRCVDLLLLQKLWGLSGRGKKDPSQRSACHCAVSRDIGINNTCPGGCVYCYATSSQELAAKNNKLHDPDFSSLLRHTIPPEQERVFLERFHEKEQISLF